MNVPKPKRIKRPFKNRPQKHKKGHGEGRKCFRWNEESLAYLAGECERLACGQFTILNERSWAGELSLNKDELVKRYSTKFPELWSQRLAIAQLQKTPQDENLHSRIFKMYWENKQPVISKEHPTRRHVKRGCAGMMQAYHDGLMGR